MVRHPVRASKFTVLWLVGVLLIFGLFLALFISTGAFPQRTLPHHVAVGPTSAPVISAT